MKLIEPRPKKMFWGDLRRPRKSLVVMMVAVVLTFLLSLGEVKAAALPIPAEEEISLEGLRQLAAVQEEQQQEDLHKMKILMTSGGGVEGVDREEDVEVVVDDTGVGVGAIRNDEEEEEDEVQAAASDVVEMLQEKQVPPAKTLEAAELLLEKYKEKIEKEEEELKKEEDEEKEELKLIHHHHPYHHRHPDSLQQEEEEEAAKPIQVVQAAALAPIPTVAIMHMGRVQNGRSLWSPQNFDRRTSELCGTSASLECGKRILSLMEGQDMSESELSLHMKCDLRDDFLKCIDTQKQDCLELATTKSVLPEMPPKETIKTERAKLWKILWTAGGCVLAN